MIGNGFIGPNYRHAKDCVFCNDCVMRGETTFVVGAILDRFDGHIQESMELYLLQSP